jgi:hypothetical protein
MEKEMLWMRKNFVEEAYSLRIVSGWKRKDRTKAERLRKVALSMIRI